ncbi:MAG: hypothetical protein QXX59_08945 [Candidatus Bathyarchaeia archaeon]
MAEKSAYETAKIASLIADSMQKILKVLERLEPARDRENMLLLIQALNNLDKAHAKLTGAGKAKSKRLAKKTLERVKEILTKNRGLEIPTIGI